MQKRQDGRKPDEMRQIKVKTGYLKHAEGSALIEAGYTRVLCAVSVENRLPFFLHGKGQGWVTGEYSLLPRSTHTRTPRESMRGKVSGRTMEIQRLIGRSLRAVSDLVGLGERQLVVDCDVLQADGGTRTLAITGAYIALYEALRTLKDRNVIKKIPLLDAVAATSVGIVGGVPMLDLCYSEDSAAQVDFNVVMTGRGRFVEVQGTAEGVPFTKADMDRMLALARKGVGELLEVQKRALKID
ncbi:ribonuclease PH [Candidatus Eisenbacteria bacterium]|uniref:Ribonuclease PH n=1 Tax=Eiseniibacteriota bacterium TaxID=2212470 RepID=A0ABV6YQK5_UNCEI